MKKYVVLGLLLLFATTLFAQQAFPPRTQKLQDAQSTGNGVELNTVGYSVVTLEIVGSEAGTDRVVTFEAWQDVTAGFIAVQCANQGTRVVSTTLTTSGTTAYHVQCDVAGFNRFRTPLSGGATGNVTVTATAISNSSAGIVAAVTTPASGITADVNVKQINGVTPLMGNGITGTGSHRVTIASDNTPFPVKTDQTTHGTTDLIAADLTKINGTAPVTGSGIATGALRVELPTNGTGVVGLNAGTALIGKVGIDQTTPATTNAVTLVPTSNAGGANALTASSVAEGSNVLKATAGNLYSLTVTTGATAGYLMIFNAASAPADGAVTPAYCAQVPANMTSATEWSIPVRFSIGVTAVFSSTGCFTKTASATVAFFGQVN